MASGYDRNTVPQEMLGEDCGECIHGVPDGIKCWECEYDYLRRDYDALEMDCVDAEDRADNLAVVVDALVAEVDDLTLMNNALTAELESHTTVDPWGMVRRMQIREHGYRVALHWCLGALEEKATSGYEQRRAVQAARKALKEEEE